MDENNIVKQNQSDKFIDSTNITTKSINKKWYIIAFVFIMLMLLLIALMSPSETYNNLKPVNTIETSINFKDTFSKEYTRKNDEKINISMNISDVLTDYTEIKSIADKNQFDLESNFLNFKQFLAFKVDFTLNSYSNSKNFKLLPEHFKYDDLDADYTKIEILGIDKSLTNEIKINDNVSGYVYFIIDKEPRKPTILFDNMVYFNLYEQSTENNYQTADSTNQNTTTPPANNKPTTPPPTNIPNTPPANNKPTTPPPANIPNTPPANNTPAPPPANNKPTTPPPTNTVPIGNQNAVKKAKSYLRFSGFSRKGLIKQLEFEGFTTAQATYGADNVGANWNEQAVKKAKSYLKLMSYSRQGLIDQLEFEGFTTAQATYGADNVGANWNEQAVKKAKSYLKLMSYSRQGLIDQLEFEGFTTEQATYGVTQNGL